MNDLQKTLLENGVYYITFCYCWYNDETRFHIRQAYDQEFLPVGVHFRGSDPDKLKNFKTVIEYEFLYIPENYQFLQGAEFCLPEQLLNKVMCFDVSSNQVLPIGTLLVDANEEEAPFMYCENPRAFFEARRSRDIKLLAKLAGHNDEWVRLGVAQNPNTSKQVIEGLAGDLNQEIAFVARERWNDKTNLRIYLADLSCVENEYLSAGRLHRYLLHPWSQVRLACIEQPETHPLDLRLLAKHCAWQIVLAVFCSEKSDEFTRNVALENLLKMPLHVKMRLAQHRKSPHELLEALLKVVDDERISARIWLNPNYKKGSRFVDE